MNKILTKAKETFSRSKSRENAELLSRQQAELDRLNQAVTGIESNTSNVENVVMDLINEHGTELFKNCGAQIAEEVHCVKLMLEKLRGIQTHLRRLHEPAAAKELHQRCEDKVQDIYEVLSILEDLRKEEEILNRLQLLELKQLQMENYFLLRRGNIEGSSTLFKVFSEAKGLFAQIEKMAGDDFDDVKNRAQQSFDRCVELVDRVSRSK